MQKFLFGCISLLIIFSAAFFYSLIFDLGDLSFQSFARDYSWMILFVTFVIPSVLLGYKKWIFLIIYSVIFVAFLIFLYYDLEKFALMNLVGGDEKFSVEIKNFLQSVKYFIVIPVLMLIIVIVLMLGEKRKI